MVIYLDAAATMPIREGVSDRLARILEKAWGTVSGSYSVSHEAKNLLEDSRERLSRALDIRPDSIVFTSGATESLNMIIQGFVRAHPESTFFYSAIEHAAVINTARYLTSQGRRATEISVDGNGIIVGSLDEVTAGDLVCVMPVNNETGVVNDTVALCRLVHERGGYVLLDCVQSFYACDPVDLCRSADFVVFSGHKIGSPKGVGVAIMKNRSLIDPLMFGGPQEWQLRPGTTPVFLIDSFVDVFCNALMTREDEIHHIQVISDRCSETIKNNIADIMIHADAVARSPHIIAMHISGIEAQMLVSMLDDRGVCVSKGSSCASGASTPSHVLTSMGIAPEDATSTIRFSFSHATTSYEVDQAVHILNGCIEQLRNAQSVSA